MVMKSEISSANQLKHLKQTVEGSSKVDLSAIIGQFWRASLYNSLIANERYLNLVARFINEEAPDEFARADFYDYISRQLVGNEDTSQKLKSLAFLMELLQVTSITYDKSLTLLTGSEVKSLCQKEVLKIENDQVSFFHSSIHSYFSAMFLRDNIEPIAFFDNIIRSEKNIAPIPATWYEVISFYIEISQTSDFTEWLILNIKKHPVLVEEGLLNALEQAYIDNLISKELKRTLFNTLFMLYKEKQVWLPDSAEVLLSRLAGKPEVEKLKKTLTSSFANETERHVTVGNVIGIVDEILKRNQPLLDYTYWHNLLIEFANDPSPNGVVQRRSLKALGHFKQATDIKLLKGASAHPDKLVHEAFLIFCYTVAPNLKTTIKYLAEGLLKDCEIFARYGFYEISTSTGVRNFLTVMSSRPIFITKFMDGESIFNDRDRHEDDRILKTIKRFLSDEVVKDAKRLIMAAYRAESGYYGERSYFIRELTNIVNTADDNFALDIANQTENEDHIYSISTLLSRCINTNNYIEILNILTKRHERFDSSNFLYLLSHEGRSDIFNDAVKRGLVSPLSAKTPATEEIDFEKERKRKIYEDFLHSLEPEKDKYLTNVFKLFMNDKDTIEELAKPEEIKRFKYLLKDMVLDSFDPAEIRVNINNRSSDGSNTNYTITSYAGYYCEAIAAAIEVYGKDFILQNYRQKLVSFLPFAYYEDRKMILDLVGELTDQEIVDLNKKYSSKKNDSRYFMTDSFFYILDRQNKKENITLIVLPTIKSLITDEKLRPYEREEAMGIYGKLITRANLSESRYLQRLFNRYKDSNEKHLVALAEGANGLLITVFQNRKATLWRFKEIENRAAPFIMATDFHDVGALEHELHDKPFGRPLTTLDHTYVGRFIQLLDRSLDILAIDKDKYMNYASYIWTLSYEYFENLSKSKDLDPLNKLERWYKSNGKKVEGANWFEHKLEQLRKSYATEFNRINDFEQAQKELLELKNNG